MIQSNYIAYVQTKRITDWKRIVLTKDSISFLYGSSDRNVFAKIPENAVLWIIESKPKRPPSLVAKLDIANIRLIDEVIEEDRDKFRHYKAFKWIAICKNTSVFYGYNNIENELLNLYFESAKKPKWKLSDQKSWDARLGRKMMAPRRISTAEYIKNPVFQKFRQKNKPGVFISWKWKNNDQGKIRELAYQLADEGYIVWLDILALPKSKALEIVASDSKKLERLLEYGYTNSDYLLAIDSQEYGIKSENSQKNWTLREWTGEISENKKMKRILVKSNQNINNRFSDEADFIIERNEVDEIVKRLKEIDENN